MGGKGYCARKPAASHRTSHRCLKQSDDGPRQAYDPAIPPTGERSGLGLVLLRCVVLRMVCKGRVWNASDSGCIDFCQRRWRVSQNAVATEQLDDAGGGIDLSHGPHDAGYSRAASTRSAKVPSRSLDTWAGCSRSSHWILRDQSGRAGVQPASSSE